MIIAFGRLFDDVQIVRSDDSGNMQRIRVPLTYAPKNKILLRADVDPDATKTTAIDLPRMAFMITAGPTYDADRKLSNLTRIVTLDSSDGNKMKRQYVPVPYNLPVSLYVYANKTMDANKIVQQILPFFTPDWTVSIEMVPETGLTFDVPIVLDSVSLDDTHWDSTLSKRRVLVWELAFTMKTYFLGPVKSKPIIKFAYERFVIAPDASTNAAVIGNTDILAQVEVQAGMTANGEPTSDASLSVDPNVIYATNTYGYIETYSSNGNISWE